MNPQIHHHLDHAELTARTGSVQAFENLVAAVRYMTIELGSLEAKVCDTLMPSVAAMQDANRAGAWKREADALGKRQSATDELVSTLLSAVASLQKAERERARSPSPETFTKDSLDKLQDELASVGDLAAAKGYLANARSYLDRLPADLRSYSDHAALNVSMALMCVIALLDRTQPKSAEKSPSFVDAAHRMMGRGPVPSGWKTLLAEVQRDCAGSKMSEADAVWAWNVGFLTFLGLRQLGVRFPTSGEPKQREAVRP